MPSKARRPCSRGCGQPATKRGLCSRHAKQSDTNRGTATQRGYTSNAHQAFRQAVLFNPDGTRKPCAITGCPEPPTVADHHPLSRRELIAAGYDPDDPQHGRPLCTYHHNQHTARDQSHLGINS